MYSSLNHKPYWNIAECYKNTGNITEAIKYYNLAFEDGHYEALTSLADFYLNCNDFKNAEKVYLKILKKDKGNGTTMLHLEHYTHGTRNHVTWVLDTPQPKELLNPRKLLEKLK